MNLDDHTGLFRYGRFLFHSTVARKSPFSYTVLVLEKIGVASVISYKLAYGVAFVAAVLFAFFANKYMVFRKKGGKLFQEILSFFGLRVASGIASFFLLVLLVDVLGLTHTMGWVLSSAINLIVNYIGSKFFIFRS